MNKKKALLAMGCSLAAVLGCGVFSACNPKEPEKTYTQDLQGVYAYAKDQGYTGTYEELIAAVKGDKGDKGDTGVGIASIEKTGEDATCDVYTITFTDNTTKDFVVKHGTEGNGIASMTTEPVEGNELATKYTITYTNGKTDSFTIVNGAKGDKGDRGVGIKNIAEKEQGAAEDGSTYVTYTITYTDNSTFDFTVNNGTIGKDGKDGVSITEVVPSAGEDVSGNPCTILTIKLSNETEYTVSVPNGAKGDKGDKGEDGKNGENGKNGVGVSSATIATDGSLVFTLTEGEPIVAGNILDLIQANQTEVMHTVKFGFYWGENEVYDEEAYATVTVRDGGKLVDPLFGEGKESIQASIVTDAEGYEADGWYYVYNGELVKWNFYGYTVTEDMSLFYVEDTTKKINYNLTYSGLEGATVYGELPTTYTKNDVLPSIAAYKIEEKTEGEGEEAVTKKYLSVFDGWTDAEGKDVEYLFVGDQALTAKWKTVEYGYSDIEVTNGTVKSGVYNASETVIISGDEITSMASSFYNTTAVKNVYIIAPNLATISNSNAFKQMKACENVIIVSDALKEGKSQMFQDSPVLKRVVFDCPNMTKLSNYTFRRCYELEYVKLPASCTVWGNGEFNGIADFDVVANFGWDYLNTLTTIGSGTFDGNKTFTEIRIDGTHFASLAAYNGMFSNNPNVTSVYIETYATSVSFYLNAINSENIERVYVHAPLATSFTAGLNNTKAKSIYVFAPNATTLGSANLTGVNVETLIVTDDPTAMPQENAAVYVVGDLTETGSLASSSTIKKAVYKVASLKGISANAFNNATELLSVHVEADNLEMIGGSAFNSCRNLRTVVLPEVAEGYQYYSSYSTYSGYGYANLHNTFRNTNKLEYVSNFTAFERMFADANFDGGSGGGFAFNAPAFKADANGYQICGTTLYGARAVKGDVVIPANITAVANDAFSRNQAITSVAFAEGSKVQTMGDGVFYQCESLKSADFTNATELVSLGEQFFANCYALGTANLPTNAGFTQIPNSMFAGGAAAEEHVALTTIHIPANVKKIGESVFARTNLATFTIAEGTQLEEIGSYAFQSTAIVDATSVLDALAGAGITVLPWGLFTESAKIESVVIPASIVEIEDRVFDTCTSLTSVTFAEESKLTTIEDQVFAGTALTSFAVPALATSMPSFRGMTSLASITFAENAVITEVNDLSNTSISSINIPASVTKIGSMEGTKLTSITIPKGVTTMTNYQFRNCASLTSVVFEAGSKITQLNNEAFKGTKITEITLPAGLTRINNYVFEDVATLATVKTEGVTSSFNTLPATLTQIGSLAFKGTSITNMVVPATVTSIGTAFQNCTKLTYLALPAGMSYSSNYFTNTPLETIKLVKSAKHASISANANNAGTNFSTSNCKYTPWYVASQERAVKLIIGEGINKITNYAFNGCKAENLTVFIEGASEIATIGGNNVPYTNATKHIGLNTTWEYDANGIPQVKAAAEA